MQLQELPVPIALVCAAVLLAPGPDPRSTETADDPALMTSSSKSSDLPHELIQDGRRGPTAAEKARYEEDTRTLDALVTALYDVISGPAGQARDWDRMRNLFHPLGRMVPLGPRPGEKGVFPSLFEIDDYVERAGPSFEQRGFFETEIARRIERFGHLSQVFSSYEIRIDPEAEEPLMRGLNAITCVFSEGRWWVLQIAWEQERDAGEWPMRYTAGSAADTPLEPAAFERVEDRDR